MFWEKFEQCLGTHVFTTYVEVEGPHVYSQNMKFQILLNKIKT